MLAVDEVLSLGRTLPRVPLSEFARAVGQRNQKTLRNWLTNPPRPPQREFEVSEKLLCVLAGRDLRLPVSWTAGQQIMQMRANMEEERYHGNRLSFSRIYDMDMEHWTDIARKQEMFERSDGFVVLPGGFGTLDEFFEVLTWRQIGLHDKPIIVIDGDGYWEPLLDLLDHLVAQGFTSRRAREGVVVVRTITELFHALDRAPEPSSKTLLTPF